MAKTKSEYPTMTNEKTPAKVAKEEDDKYGAYGEYEVKQAMETLKKAEEIKADPKMMKLVLAHAGHEKKRITSIQALRAKKNEMDDEATEAAAGESDDEAAEGEA